MNKLVILDRDGVINHDSPNYITTPDEWSEISGSAAAIARLNYAGWAVAVATNQSGIARGLFSLETLDLIHQRMHRCLTTVGARIDAITYCPHGPEDHCVCRKPRAGMLESLAQRFQVQLHAVWVIGDSWRDIVAAQQVGAMPILVHTGNGHRTAVQYHYALHNIVQCQNLALAVDYILTHDVKT
jgi:D-glycero-D-manno-heptose 1,7-bisphosphate phosphatase